MLKMAGLLQCRASGLRGPDLDFDYVRTYVRYAYTIFKGGILIIAIAKKCFSLRMFKICGVCELTYLIFKSILGVVR